MRALFALLVLAATLVAATEPEQPLRGRFGDLRSDAAYLLEQADGVARVEKLVQANLPKHRIIHIADWHTVPFEFFAADLRDQGETNDEVIANEFRMSEATTKVVQANQRKLLHWLGRYHGVRQVHLEGLSDRDIEAYRFMVRSLGRRGADRLPPDFGAAAQAFVAGDIDDVLPAEDESAFEAAKAAATERFGFDGPENDAREAAIVRRLVSSGPLSVIVLGGDHDLSKHVRAVGGCEYLRVFGEGYPQ